MKTLEKNKIPLSLRLNFSWTLIGNIIYAACQWGLLIMLAKFGSPDMVGIYSLGLALTAPVFMLTNLQLRSVIATDTEGKHSFNNYLGLRLICILLAIIIISIIIFMANYNYQTVAVLLIICLAKGIEATSDVIYGVLQKEERMDFISKSMIIKGITSILFMGITLLITQNLIYSVVALAFAWLLVMLLYDIKNVRHLTTIKPYFEKGSFFELIRLSLPLGIVMMLLSFNSNVPRYIIDHYLDADSLGYYSAIAYIVIAGTTVVNALGQSATPRLSKNFANRELKEARRLLVKLVIIASLLGSLGILIAFFFGKQILSLLYNNEYSNYSSEFVLVMVYAFFAYLSSFLGYSMTAARLFKIQPLLFIVVTLSNVIFSILLVPVFGMRGAIYGLIIAGVIQFLGSLLINIFIFRDKRKQSGGQFNNG
ncbi:oligosaccharide flippase family protein [Falsibacillus pallidus]|uniref:O-antigen/teichoic acid export membrane protein n=1 Tax=Falsibacillus pallidus TaxID=493781 RepID=A0A370GD84_9BACI|nr:oligosaccharide flippase family protein [Falsibacillus pallidus]RDI41657.1 O-antigen/teichoic acid export membrane protein [Falsibacillus pallidus]